ncbi:MAG: DUF92 domain-containing protein [Bacteroidetes bacterium]|nr:DUF92 domain-containing protein [Bacteroidota bacterium]
MQGKILLLRHQFMEDILAIISLITIILFSTITSEALTRYGLVQATLGRKLLHISAITSCAVAPLIIANHIVFVCIVASFTIILFFAVRKKLFQLDQAHHRSWGIFFFVLAFLILIVLCHPHSNYLIFYPMIIMAWSDSVAGLVGIKFSKKYFQPISEKKSLLGCLAFFSTSCLIFGLSKLFPGRFPVIPLSQDVAYFISAVIIIGLMLTLCEAVSTRGSDNLSVPLVAAILMHLLFENKTSSPIVQYWFAMMLAVLFAAAAYRYKLLSLSGSLTALALAFFVFGIGGLAWSVPILLFFVSGSLASKLNKKSGVSSDAKSKRPRDYIQVICNGGVGLVCIWCYGITANTDWYLVYLVSIAVSTADTLSSEIGIYMRRQTVHIINFKKLPTGVSGGVSLPGTLAAAVGAACIAAVGVFYLSTNYAKAFVLITTLGFAGSIADSIIGACLQAKYMHTDTVSDVPQHPGDKLISGMRWMTNDMVNILANIIISLLAVLLINIPQ